MTNEIKRSVLLVAIMIVLCFVSSASSAQNLMITVKSDLGQPVSYAGISLNGRHMAATDSVGMGSIPLYRLSLGDTISVTYIGTTKGTAIFDQTMRRERSCIITVHELYVELEPVTIQSDIEKIFLKYTNFHWVVPALYPSLVVQGDFKVKLCSDASFNQPVITQGTFSAKNRRSDKSTNDSLLAKALYFRIPADLITMNDTTGISLSLQQNINYVLDKSNMFLNSLQYKKVRDKCNIRYGFLGIDRGCRIFRLSLTTTDGYLSQFLIFSDVKTYNIRRMELRTLSPPEDRFEKADNPKESVDIVMECEEIKGNFTTPATTFINSIKAKIELFKGDLRFSEIELSNMTIRSKK